jgi:hypothetical protein
MRKVKEGPSANGINPSGINSPVSRGRHEHHCRIWRHARRAEIESAYVNWVSTARIAYSEPLLERNHPCRPRLQK